MTGLTMSLAVDYELISDTYVWQLRVLVRPLPNSRVRPTYLEDQKLIEAPKNLLD